MKIIKEFTVKLAYNDIERENYIDDSKLEVTDEDIIQTEIQYIKEGNWSEDLNFCDELEVSNIKVTIEE